MCTVSAYIICSVCKSSLPFAHYYWTRTLLEISVGMVCGGRKLVAAEPLCISMMGPSTLTARYPCHQPLHYQEHNATGERLGFALSVYSMH